MVALTFDDGPVLQTHRVLDTLARHDARATFFLVGYKMDGHQALIERFRARATRSATTLTGTTRIPSTTTWQPAAP